MKFTGKVVLITGAGSGIGAATALQFSLEGACVSLTDRNEEGLRQTARRCQEAGVDEKKIFTVTGDVTEEKDCWKMVDNTIERFARLDILVNNAGWSVMKGILSSTLADLDDMLNIFVRGNFNVTQRALPTIVKYKGAIVNVSSIASFRPSRSLSVYSIAKAALDQYTKILALEMADKGVRVNSVNPGIIMTGIMGDLDSDEKVYHGMTARESFAEFAAAMSPCKRAGQPEEVARAIAFLASADASFIHGAILPVDGARHLASPERAHID